MCAFSVSCCLKCIDNCEKIWTIPKSNCALNTIATFPATFTATACIIACSLIYHTYVMPKSSDQVIS